MLTFLHNVCGISFSPKRNIDIPELIKSSSTEIKKYFLKGLADTDFSLVFKKDGSYPVISHNTCSFPLHNSLKVLLLELDFKFNSITRNRLRLNKSYISYQIEICGKNNLSKWMKTIGFSSYNTLTRYDVWNKTGHLDSRTNLIDRLAILKVHNNPNKTL